MKKADHRDQAEEQLGYADTQITGNAEAMLQSAHTHALLALIDAIEAQTYIASLALGIEEE